MIKDARSSRAYFTVLGFDRVLKSTMVKHPTLILDMRTKNFPEFITISKDFLNLVLTPKFDPNTEVFEG